MNNGHFASGGGSLNNRKSASAKRKGRKNLHAFVEGLESRMLLSVTPATSTQAITLTGNATAITTGETTPILENSTNFGGADSAGSSPVTVTYTIENSGSGALTLTGSTPVTISGADSQFFKVSKQPGASVAQGASTTFTITFTPTAVGVDTATVTIASSDPAGPFTFAIKGTGTTTGAVTLLGNGQFIDAGETTPTSANWTDFGVTDANGTLTLSRTYTLENLTDSTLNTIGSDPVTITGSGASDFTVTTQPNSGITDGSPASFTINFTPTTAGVETAEVSIATSDPGGTFTFEIQGDGLTMTAVGTQGLLIDTTTPGRGTPTAQNNEILVMAYAGYLTDGTLFDSVLLPDHAQPYFEFELGVGQVIAGWDQGLVGMKIGESRTLIIPSALAYGSSGTQGIPGGATLIFDTTLLDIINVQTTVSGSAVSIPDGEDDPTTATGTIFGASATSQTFTVTSYGGSLSDLLATPAVSMGGSAAFTATQLVINGTNTVGMFTVTYTPANNVSTALVSLVNAISTNPNYTFLVQATGPASDDGTATYSASTDDITGFAYNPSDLSTTDEIEVAIANGPTTVPQEILANEPSPELQGEFGTVSHDFTYAMPVLTVGTHSVQIFAIDPATNSKTLIGTTSVTSQNSLFDDHYYLATYPNVAAAVADGQFATGYDHYIQFGQFEGFNPNPYWNEAWYLKENPDVAAAVKAGTISSGFMHYYLYGQYEGRGGLLYFNTTYYLDNNPAVVTAIADGQDTSAFQHFMDFGQYEGIAPMLYFSSTYYDAHNSFILNFVTGEPMSSDFEQFILYGQYEGLQASTLYNEATYLADNPDVAAAVSAGVFPDGFQHWLEYGQFEGRTAV